MIDGFLVVVVPGNIKRDLVVQSVCYYLFDSPNTQVASPAPKCVQIVLGIYWNAAMMCVVEKN